MTEAPSDVITPVKAAHRHVQEHESSCFEVDLSAIAHNVRALRSLIGGQTQLYAALKADAYGFGLVRVSQTLADAGIDALAVARMQDAIELRTSGTTLPILLYGGALVTPASIRATEEYELVPTILDLDAARLYSRLLARERPVFVKVDVGQRRLGVEPRGVKVFVEEILALPKLNLDGLYTHMAVPPDPVPPGYLERQFDVFQACVAELEEAGITPRVRMAASSSVLRLSRNMNLNAVDPGVIYFGLVDPGPGTDGATFRSPFRALKTSLIQVKTVDDDSRPPPLVPVTPGMRIGIIPLGTADGLSFVTTGRVLLHGRYAPLIEPISLEHCRVDLTDHPNASVGDEVVIIGAQANERIALEDVTGLERTPEKHDLAVRVRSSVPRVYI